MEEAILTVILDWVVTNIVGSAVVLLGFIILIGLVLQKKKWYDVLAGTMKTMIGFMIMGMGAGVIAGTLIASNDMLVERMGITGIYQFNEILVGYAMADFGKYVAPALFLAFLINVLLARITPLKNIFLTGHQMVFNAMCASILLVLQLGLEGLPVIIGAAIIAGLYQWLAPAMAQPIMRKLTGQNIGYGHGTTTGCVVGAYVGKFFGDPKDSTEKIKLPESLGFFRDSTIGTGFTMAILYTIVSLISGLDVAAGYSGGTDPIVWSILQGLTFGGGVCVLLTGVRMLIAEIVPAFKGFADYVVPDSIPSLDCPVVMPFAPMAWMLGFVVSLVISVVMMFVLGGLGFPYLIIPSVIIAFFEGGPAGVFGNTLGGKNGAIVAAIIDAIIFSVGTALLCPLMGYLLASGAIFSGSDFAVWFVIVGYLLKFIGGG